MIRKEINNFHYDDVRGDFLRPSHGKTPATVEQIKSKKGSHLETKNTQNHENLRRGLIIKSLHIHRQMIEMICQDLFSLKHLKTSKYCLV